MIATLTMFIKSFFAGLIISMANLIVDIAQNGYDGLIDFICGVVGMFPTGPALPSVAATPTGQTFQLFLQCLNWIFPVGFMLSMIQWSAEGYLLFLFVAPIARFFKLVT